VTWIAQRVGEGDEAAERVTQDDGSGDADRAAKGADGVAAQAEALLRRARSDPR
jgi:hypothetical protein